MPLRKRVIDLPIKGGLNQKVSEKGLVPPDLLKLTNGRYIKEGRIDKRFGYTNLGVALSSGTVNTPTTLGAIRDELLMLTADNLYSYTDKNAKWNSRGPATLVSTKLSPITASLENASELDMIVQDGVKVIIWFESNQWQYTVIDQDTGTTIVSKTLLAAGISALGHLRIASINGQIGIFYVDPGTTDLTCLLIPTSNPTTSSTATLYSGAAGVSAGGAFDVQGLNDHFYVFFKITAVNNCRISKLDNTLAVVATNTHAASPTNSISTCINAFSSTYAGKDLIYLGWDDSVDGELQGKAYNVNLVEEIAQFSIATLSNPGRMIIVDEDNAAGTVSYIYAKDTGASTKARVTAKYTTDTDGTAGTAADFMYGIFPITRGISVNDTGYFVALYESTLQPTYFAISTSGQTVAKWAAGEAGLSSDQLRAGTIATLNTTDFEFAALKKGRIESENAQLFADKSPHFATLSFNTAKSGPGLVAQDSFNIPTGLLSSYDGKSLVEYGFNTYPEDSTFVETAAGTSMTTGDYLCYALYEWVDDRGIRQQSNPDVGTVTISAGSKKIVATVDYLKLTQKSSESTIPRAEVKIKIYMTEAGGTVPYYVAEADNDITGNTVDIDIIAEPDGTTEILYTSGGALENIAPPSHSFAFTHDNRFVIVGLENPNEIRFSKEFKPLTMPGFNEDLSIILDPTGGDAVAGASMDSNMVIFKETATYVISGSGPNDLGENSTYGSPQLISADIGCKDIRSILQLPEGIIFKSNKGIYLLDRSLNLTYIGSPVEDYNSTTILSSDILKTSEEVRFVTDADVTLVYNYYFKRWSVFTTPGALDATTWQTDRYVYLSPTKVLKEDSSTYLDDGSYVPTTIKTGWVHLKGMQGFQRVYRLGLLGSYGANHQFQIKTYLDYSEIVKDTVNITASSVVNTALYGDSATYGDDSFYGGNANDEVYQLRVHLAQQKCEAISFEISDSQITGSTGQGFSLEGLSLEIGGKGGIFRLSSSRSN
jgi:hypothetical protein